MTISEAQRVAIDTMNGMARLPVGKALCGAEIHDGNNDDPSYAYCGLPSAHAGEHGKRQM